MQETPKISGITSEAKFERGTPQMGGVMLMHSAGHYYAINTAVNKTDVPFGVNVVRGLLANWLVSSQCILAFQAPAFSLARGCSL